MCITLDIVLPASAYYLGYCIICQCVLPIALSANVCYLGSSLGYCLICQCVLPGILPCLPVGVTWDIALSANVYYLGYRLVCQCVLPYILPCLPMCVIWDTA